MSVIYISEQDLDLVHHIARGKTYREAGAALGIGEQSVKNRMRHLYLAFGARHIAHLTAIWIATGILYLPDLYQDVEVKVREYRRGKSRRTYQLCAVRV